MTSIPEPHVPTWRRAWPTAWVVACVAPALVLHWVLPLVSLLLVAMVAGTAALVGYWARLEQAQRKSDAAARRQETGVTRQQRNRRPSPAAEALRRAWATAWAPVAHWVEAWPVRPLPWQVERWPAALVGLAATVLVAGPTLPVSMAGPSLAGWSLASVGGVLAWLLRMLLWASPALSVVGAWWACQSTTWRRTSPEALAEVARAQEEERRRAALAAPRGTWAELTAPTKGGKSRALTGTRLGSPAWGTHGWWAPVDLGDGDRMTWETVAKARPTIAKAYGVPRGLVHVVPGDDESTARVGVLSRDPLAESLPWDGPTMTRSGVWVVGRYADGRVSRAQLWDGKSGSSHGFVVGETGSGKSSPWGVLMAEAILRRRVVVGLADPDGRSLAGAPERVDYFAEGDDSGALIAGWRELLEARARAKMTEFEPSYKHPLALLVIEEWPSLAGDKELLGHVARLVKSGRKFNISIILVGQSANADEHGGSAIRNQAMSGNAWIFRVANRSAGSVALGDTMPGVSPESIPRRFAERDGAERTYGVGYFPGDDRDPMLHRARFMADWDVFDERDAQLTEGSEQRAARPRTVIEDGPRARLEASLPTQDALGDTPAGEGEQVAAAPAEAAHEVV